MKFSVNWLNESGEEDLKISSMYFSYFVIIEFCGITFNLHNDINANDWCRK